MEPFFEPEKNSPPLKKVILLTVSGFLIGLIAIVSIVVLALRFDLLAKFQRADPIPTADCSAPSLVLGGTTFQIKNTKRGADGAVHVPPEPSGIAYWIEGTDDHPVFVLPPTPQNLAVVSTINLGSAATATWPDCTVLSYYISAHEPGSFQAANLPDQSQKGITIYFPIDASGAGFVFSAGLPSEQVNVANAPAPLGENTPPSSIVITSSPSSTEGTLPPSIANTTLPSVESTSPSSITNPATPSVKNTLPAPLKNTSTPSVETTLPCSDWNNSKIQADIGVLEMKTSPDGKTIALNVSIYNSGGSAFTLSANCTSLVQGDGTPLGLTNSEPPLPQEIASADFKMFIFTFPHPSSATATLKVLTAQYELEGY